MVSINETLGLGHGDFNYVQLADNEDLNEIQTQRMREALAQIEKGFEENQTCLHRCAGVREGWKMVKETYECKRNEALTKIHELHMNFKAVSH